jgi:hypothetical protein
VSRRAGPNHYTLRDGGAARGLCGDRSPLGNLRRVPLGLVKAECEILVCFVPRDGYDVHALHLDCRTVLGRWFMWPQPTPSRGSYGT